MDKIRSLQIIRKFLPDGNSDEEKMVRTICCNLANSGIQTGIIATKAKSEKEMEIIKEIPIRRFDYFYPYLNLSEEAAKAFDLEGGDPFSWQIYRYLIKSGEADILHCHSAGRLANIVRLAAGKKKLPYVVTIHHNTTQSHLNNEVEPDTTAKGFGNYGKLIDRFLKSGNVLKDAAGILCLGYESFCSLQQNYPDKIVTYFHEGVDVARFKVESVRNFRLHHQINPAADIVLCAGEIEPQKNQMILVELANLLREKHEIMHLILLGHIASEDYYRRLRQQISKLKLEKNVTFLTGLDADDPEYAKAYQAADFFILPSLRETAEKTVLEAWASRLPVIAHRVDVLQKLIIHKHNGLIFENDSLFDLAEQYFLLRDHPDLRVKLIHNAYEEVCCNCSWPALTGKLLEFYRTVIEKYHNGGK